MIQYLIQFSCEASATSGMATSWSTTAQGIKNTLSIPREFEGPGGALSPEDLFSQALTNCFVATFKVYAQMSRLEFDSVSASSLLVVDLNEAKKPVMKSIKVSVTITRPSNPEKALSLAEKTARSGFILNSVKTECSFEFLIA